MPSSLGAAEILAIVVVALIFLGPKRLPEAVRHVGKAFAEVRRWSHDVKSELHATIDPKHDFVSPTSVSSGHPPRLFNDGSGPSKRRERPPGNAFRS